ncbi:hypothetical protein M9458_037209, partial [Cirrhinus mrigala]
MLKNSGFSLTASEPKIPTGLVQEPVLDTIKPKRLKPEADLNLTDLWSTYPFPTLVPTLKPLGFSPIRRPSSSDVPAGFPGPISSAGFSQFLGFVGPTGVIQLLGSAFAASFASPPPAQYSAESPAAPRSSRPMSPPRPLCISLSPQRPICPRTPLGSLIHPEKPRLVIAPASATDFQVPSCASTLHPFGSTRLLLSSGFPSILAYSIVALCRIPVSTSIMRASHSTLSFQAFDVTLVYQPFCSAGSAFIDGLPSATQSFGQSSTLVPPTVGSMVLVFSNSS